MGVIIYRVVFFFAFFYCCSSTVISTFPSFNFSISPKMFYSVLECDIVVTELHGYDFVIKDFIIKRGITCARPCILNMISIHFFQCKINLNYCIFNHSLPLHTPNNNYSFRGSRRCLECSMCPRINKSQHFKVQTEVYLLGK